MSYTLEQITKMDIEMHELQALYSKAKIHFGLELARRLKVFEDNKLYLKLDEQSYPNFPTYLKSVGVNYKTAREIIGLYEAYVEVAGFTIKELGDAGYSKLTVIKPKFFKKEGGKYLMLGTKTELNKWVTEAKSDITQEDLRQKVREDMAGEHEHKFAEVHFKYCIICKLKEPIFYGKQETKKED
mgnify:CR=1 FL=1